MKTIKNYLSHLNPKLDALFQRPREVKSFNPDEDKVWFCNAPIGLNTLNTMMKSMSSRAGIQPHLTNHCLRATSVAVLPDRNCETRHIRSVTGHKSDQSIESYNERPSLEQQRMMSNVLSTFLHSSEASRQSSSSACSADKENTTATNISLKIHQQRQFKQLLRPFSFSTTSSRLIQTAWQASHMAIEGNVLLLISTFITIPMSIFTIISVPALEFLLSTCLECLFNCFAM